MKIKENDFIIDGFKIGTYLSYTDVEPELKEMKFGDRVLPSPFFYEKNKWFSNETPEYDIPKTNSAAGIGMAMETIKQTSNAMSLYRGVEDLVIKSTGSSLYEEEEEDGYVTSDPFSKLKFDDLRKVHKDQTVFAVSEHDYQSCKTYASHDELRQARGSQVLTPMEKREAERILREREQVQREKMLAKQHTSNLQTMEYQQKNKTVLASFLYLEH
jgi:hypothetical protein